MSRKLGAWSRERRIGGALSQLKAESIRHTAHGIRHILRLCCLFPPLDFYKPKNLKLSPKAHGKRQGPRGRKSEARGRKAAGFSLVELLVTVAIIAIMSTLLTPAVRGLMGVTGPRGGVNVVSSAIEQARLSAMESGSTAYVGFPFQSGSLDEDVRYSSLIVFREGRSEENEPSYVPVTRWLRLPQGVFIDDQASPLGQTESPGSAIPKLGGEPVSTLNVLRFDRFGRLVPSKKKVTLKIGEKAEARGEFLGASDKYFEITVQPLTGRAIVVDKGAERK